MKVAEGPFRSERGTPVLTGFTHKLVYRVVGPAMRRVGRVDHQGLAQFACLAIKPLPGAWAHAPRVAQPIKCGK